MHVILKSRKDGGTRRIVIRAGQIVRVGSTEWADFCVSDDDQLAPEHFAVECTGQGCRVQSLGDRETRVNGEPIQLHDAKDGDEIVAGRSTFQLTFYNAPQPEGADAYAPEFDETAAPAKPPVWPNLRAPTLEELEGLIPFSNDALGLLGAGVAPDEFVATLRAADLPTDALQFFAHAMPARSAMWWALQCLETVPELLPDEPEQQALESVRQWCLDGLDATRSDCGAAAARCPDDRPPGLLAIGASWTGGSMAPAELPTLPPDPSLPGHMATAALATAAGLREDMMGAIDGFLDLAPPIACGDVPWEPAADSDSEG